MPRYWQSLGVPIQFSPVGTAGIVRRYLDRAAAASSYYHLSRVALSRWELDGLMVPGDTLSLVGLITGQRPAWMDDAACLEHPEIEFVPPSTRTEANAAEKARSICAGCLCRRDCLAYALADDALLGVWAGTTTAERRTMRRAVA